MIKAEATKISKAAQKFIEELKKIEQNQQEIIRELGELDDRVDELEECIELELEKNLL